MFTANTMSSSFEALGLSLLGSSMMASPDQEKIDSAEQSAIVLINAVKKKYCPEILLQETPLKMQYHLLWQLVGQLMLFYIF